MSILQWLGLAERDRSAIDSLGEVEKALGDLEPARARFLACFAYILGRVARADHDISDAEVETMARIVAERGSLPPDQAGLVARIAQSQGLRHGGTDDFLVTRQFAEIADRTQRLSLLDCLFAVSAADQSIRTIEDNEIRRIASELKLEHADFIAARSAHAPHFEVLKGRRPREGSG